MAEEDWSVSQVSTSDANYLSFKVKNSKFKILEFPLIKAGFLRALYCNFISFFPSFALTF